MNWPLPPPPSWMLTEGASAKEFECPKGSSFPRKGRSLVARQSMKLLSNACRTAEYVTATPYSVHALTFPRDWVGSA